MDCLLLRDGTRAVADHDRGAAFFSPALFVNPVGVKMILYPLNTMLAPGMSFSPIEEWQPLQFNDGRNFAFLAVLAGIFLLVIIRRTEFFWRELLVLVVGAWLAASHVRMLFVFGIVAAPILSRLSRLPGIGTTSSEIAPSQMRC